MHNVIHLNQFVHFCYFGLFEILLQWLKRALFGYYSDILLPLLECFDNLAQTDL